MSLFLYYFCYQCLVWDVYKFLKLIFRIVFEFVKDEPVPAFDRDRTHCQSRRCTDLDPGRLRHPLRLSQRPSLTLAIWSSSANLSNVQQRYMVPHAVWKMAKLFCDQIHDRYSCLHYWSEICWKSKLDVSGESSCDWCTMRITAGMDVWSNISRRWEARTILMILRWGTPLTDSYLGSTSIGEKNLNAFIVLDTNAKELTTDRVWFLKYLQETWWTKTNGCREQNFTWGSKRKDGDPIWPNASLTSCLSVYIRLAVTH